MTDVARIHLDLSSLEDYRKFLEIKKLPSYAFVGRMAEFPTEYADRIGVLDKPEKRIDYIPFPGLWDYQNDISKLMVEKRKFGCFAECGLGKTMIMWQWARHAKMDVGPRKRVLLISPLMVIEQTIEEIKKFFGEDIEQIRAKDLDRWMTGTGDIIGITNYEALKDSTPRGNLGALGLDEGSMLASFYGKHGQQCMRLGAGLHWKSTYSGTPAPNDRIEYGPQAVFLDAFPSLNAFLARFFVNRGQTSNRWEIKPHAVEAFYRSLSHWSIFLVNPGVYGWQDNAGGFPPINVHIHDVNLTVEQSEIVRSLTGTLFPCDIGGITKRSTMGQLAKGRHNGKSIATNKPKFIHDLIETWTGKSTIIWCLYDEEQRLMERTFPEAASIAGWTKHEKRMELLRAFRHGEIPIMISKGKVLGLGLNLQVARHHVFSGIQDSYQTWWQCLKRSNRYGSNEPLDAHIPCTDIEYPMIATIMRKANRIREDTEIQERLFKKESGYVAQ